jgi:LPXTG-motif cell wall-anchored protein
MLPIKTTYEVTYSYDGVSSVATITVSDKNDSISKRHNNKGENSQNTGGDTFPQSGEKTNNIWGLAGFLTLICSLILLVNKREKSH